SGSKPSGCCRASTSSCSARSGEKPQPTLPCRHCFDLDRGTESTPVSRRALRAGTARAPGLWRIFAAGVERFAEEHRGHFLARAHFADLFRQHEPDLTVVDLFVELQGGEQAAALGGAEPELGRQPG